MPAPNAHLLDGDMPAPTPSTHRSLDPSLGPALGPSADPDDPAGAEEPSHVDDYGNRIWLGPDGRRHRTTGPAVLKANGDREWWKHGKRHRADGPAIEYNNGTRTWMVHGYLVSAREDVYLDELYDDGQMLVLEGVLGALTPYGPTVPELIAAVRVAMLPSSQH